MSAHVRCFINAPVAVIKIKATPAASYLGQAVPVFPLEHFIEMRAQCSFVTKDELDLILMVYISSVMLDSDAVKGGHHLQAAKCRRITTAYKHHGVHRGLQKKSFSACHWEGPPLVTSMNKQEHTMPSTIMHVVSFLGNYAAYKRDNIQLLPFNHSKMVRHLLSYFVKYVHTKIWEY